MFSTKRCYVAALLLCLSAAGCTPANYVRTVRQVPQCEVQVCVNPDTGLQRCDCRTTEQVERQFREAGWLWE